MMYSLIFLANDKVSWINGNSNKKDRCKTHKAIKAVESAEEMCELANPLAPILDQIYKIEYDEKPDYEALIQLFVRALL